jgi:hypothetical protein
VPDQIIPKVTARPRPDGIDLDRLALVLIETVDKLPKSQRKRLAAEGERLIADAERRVGPGSDEGAA